jgi:hypothetical protein
MHYSFQRAEDCAAPKLPCKQLQLCVWHICRVQPPHYQHSKGVPPIASGHMAAGPGRRPRLVAVRVQLSGITTKCSKQCMHTCKRTLTCNCLLLLPHSLHTTCLCTHLQGSQAPLEDFDQLVEGPWPISTNCPQRSLRGQAECNLAGDLVEKPPVSGPNFRSAGRRPFQSFHNFGPSAREFRPVDELASPAHLTCAYTANGAPAQTPHLHDHGPLLAYAPQSTVTQVSRHCSTAAAQQHNETCYSRALFAQREVHSCSTCHTGLRWSQCTFPLNAPSFAAAQLPCKQVTAVCLAQLPRTTATLPTKQRRPANCERAHGCWPRPAAPASSCTRAAVWHYKQVLKAVHAYME